MGVGTMHLLATFVTVLALTQTPAATKAEQLQDAARKGDAATVKQLLDAGVDVNTKYRYNATAIFYACDAGHLDVVKVLLDHGADLTIKDTFYGFTPLMLAVSPARTKTPAHNEIAKLLIAKGAPGKEMALSSAIDDDDEALAKVILDSGGVPPAVLTDSLEQARADKKAKTAALLEKAGAKPYDDFKLEPAQLAKFAGTYHDQRGTEIVIAVDGSRLSAHFGGAPPEQRAPLAAKDATTFRGIGMGGATIAFKVDGDKVTGFTVTSMQGPPQTYTRVEGK
jgi:ankyrin repeat protein